MTKYEKAQLPSDAQTALEMAAMRDEWAKEALARDQYGSAREFELSALLLRQYALVLQAKARP